MHSRDLDSLTRKALAAFVAWLDGAPATPEGAWDDLAKRYADAKARLGRQAVADRLGMNEADLGAFDTALREMVRRLSRLGAEPSTVDDRNALIAQCRLLGWLEAIDDGAADLTLELKLPAGSSADVGRKQVRALELILRSLVDEHYEDQGKLTARLKELLSEKVVQQWLAAADKGDLLSGTTFSELASLFVSQQEFPAYEGFYKETPFLTLLKEKRVTIRHYLDDIRRIRNLLAHNKKVTPLQVQLLALYYEELVEPIQEAFDQGRTKVNPDVYLDVSEEELESYFGALKTDIKGVRDDIAELRAELTGRLDAIAGDTAEIKKTSSGTSQRTKLILAGVGALAVIGGATIYLLTGTKEEIAEIRTTTEETQNTLEEVQETTQNTQEAIEQMAEGLKQLANSGGLVADPKTPAELYHNARLLAQRGEVDLAIEAYKKLFAFPIPYADPVLDLVALLKAKYGQNGAAAALESVLAPETDARIREFATLAAGGETAMAAAIRLQSVTDPYLPTLWLTAQGLMSMPYQEFSFGLRKLALTYMQAVKAAMGDGSFARLYLDQIRVDGIRGELAGYERQFPAGVMEAYDQPLMVDWEQYEWFGAPVIRVMFMWNSQAAAMNALAPPELWARFVGLPAPYDQPYNLLDPATAVAAQRASYPPDMEVPPELNKMVTDLALQQNPMATQLVLPRPPGAVLLAEVTFTEVGGIARHFCLAIPNDNGAGNLSYRDLKECGATP